MSFSQSVSTPVNAQATVACQSNAEAVWVSVSPSLAVFDQPLLRSLARRLRVAKWSYEQSLDESCSVEIPLTLLHDYLKGRSQPVHLLGHGLGGAVALLYARRHPERVRSLTLLAVAEQPAVTWHAHYYVQRHLLPCSAERLLARLALSLFRCPTGSALRLVQVLRQDLATAPLLHSACHIESLPQGGVSMPLLVCGAEDDAVVHPETLGAWDRWMKPGDRQWICPEGSHFFHYGQADAVAREVAIFWRSLSVSSTSVP